MFVGVMKTLCLSTCLFFSVCLLTSCEAARKSKSKRFDQNELSNRDKFDDLLNHLAATYLSGSISGGIGDGNQRPTSPDSGQIIRLSGSGTQYYGLLEVYVSGRWGYVCDDQWDKVNADVACRQLGFMGGSTDFTSEGKSPKTGDIIMDDVTCGGSEERLQDCQFEAKDDCTLSEAIKIQCKHNTGCPEGEVAGVTKCYGFFTTARNIKEAKNKCKQDNSELLQIDSEEENHFISNIFNAYKSKNIASFWFTAGMKSGNKWTWPGKTDIKVNKWMSVSGQQEPVEERSHRCLALTNKPADRGSPELDYFFWRAMPCRATGGLSFVCQRSKMMTETRTTRRARPTTPIPSRTPSTDLTVSLVGGQGRHEGNVEVNFAGEKYRICDDEWDENDVRVVCRMLGFNYGGVPTEFSHFGRDSVPILLDNMDCSGHEMDITQCSGVVGIGKNDCSNREFAGVICNTKPGQAVVTVPPSTTEAHTTNERVSVRLVGGHPHAGTVEVTRAGVTGVICDDDWDLQDGHVVCRMLGYQGAKSVTERNSFDFVMKGDQFLLDDVNCTGRETNLAQCKHKPWGRHNCGQTEVAGVECVDDSEGPITPNPTPTPEVTTPEVTTPEVTTPEVTTPEVTTPEVTTPEVTTPMTPRPTRPSSTGSSSSLFTVSLVGGNGNHEGNVELTYRGKKYRICDDQWDDKEANVICRMLGFKDGGFPTSESYFGRSQLPILLDDVNCSGQETEIGQCRAVVGTRQHDCVIGHEDAGVKCNKDADVGVQTQRPSVFGQCGYRPIDKMDLFANFRKRRSSYGFSPVAEPKKTLKVVGGKYATHGEYPWQARVQKMLSATRGSQHCGAAIINNHWLLSAAHCFVNRRKSQFRIIVGEHDIRKEDEGEQTFRIEELIMHEGYLDGGKHNDIALIKIRPNSGRAMQFNNYVQPACLASSSTPHVDGTECLISGWGNTKQASNPYPKVLKAARVPLWSQDKCRYIFRHKIRAGYDDGMMCAGMLKGGVDTCDGDSGGPLVCNIQGSYTLLGLTSFGFGCAKAVSPGVYARVAHFIPWINEKMAAYSNTRAEKVLPQRP